MQNAGSHYDIDALRVIGSTNTQTRRLGYIVQVCRFLSDEYRSVVGLQREIEDWAEENQDYLNEHISDKGIIRRSSRSSGAKRYIKLSQDLQLVAEVGGYLRLTKTGRVLVSLGEGLCSETNPFMLRKAALLFCYQLFLLDADYLLAVMELTRKYSTQDQLLEYNRQHLLSRFSALETSASSPLVRSKIHERYLSVYDWKKPKVYSEHLVMPRLHWLLDLELLDGNMFRESKEFTLSSKGSWFLDQIPMVNGQRTVNRYWCQNDFFMAWSEMLKLKPVSWLQLSESEREKLIEEYVTSGFNLFRTMVYPRISAYQLVLHIILRMFYDKQILADFDSIKQALDRFSSLGAVKWRFHWSATDDDGFLLFPT